MVKIPPKPSTVRKLLEKQKKEFVYLAKLRRNRDPEHVPVMEDQALAEDQLASRGEAHAEEGPQVAGVVLGAGGSKRSREEGKGKRKAGQDKRKRDEYVHPAKKKRKRAGDDDVGDVVGVDVDTANDDKPKREKAKRKAEGESAEEVNSSEGRHQRLILFVGNLKYTTTLSTIQAHFSSCDPAPHIRLLTPKPKSPSSTPKATPKSKGCAFLEFTSRTALQQALKLHASTLEGRVINVELTAGGGGKGEGRLGKVRERNKELAEQRRKRLEKTNADADTLPARPQRYSSTSGVAQVPTVKRTWTVGDAEEEGTHRGGVKHVKKRGAKRKNQGTGVNAIPVE